MNAALKNTPTPQNQRGAILIISLVLLTAVTIIGVAGVRSTIIEEKMAGNMRDRATAFNAAEAALKRGMQFFVPLVGTGLFGDGSNGQYLAEPEYWKDSTWQNSNSFIYTKSINSVDDVDAIEGVASQPRYVLRFIGSVGVNKTSLGIGGYGDGTTASGDVSDFSIIARGTGGSDNSVVLLRARFGKRL